jgi:hypothetical protein
MGASYLKCLKGNPLIFTISESVQCGQQCDLTKYSLRLSTASSVIGLCVCVKNLVVASKETGLEVNIDKLTTWSCLEVRMQDEVTV